MSTSLARVLEEYTFEENLSSDKSDSFRLGKSSTEDFVTASINTYGIKPDLQVDKIPFSKPPIEIPIVQYADEIKGSFSGVVLEINGGEIKARIKDLLDREKPEEIVTFDLEEFDEREHGLAQVGALFYWHIGYRKGNRMSKQRFSIMKFRRLPTWKASEISSAADEANSLVEFFNID